MTYIPFKVWSLVLSSGCLPKLPSVLLTASSSSVKKSGRSFMAHLHRSFSDCKVARTRCTFRGVTQLRKRSSFSGVMLLLTLTGCGGNSRDSTSGLSGNCGNGLKASASIVNRLALHSTPAFSHFSGLE